MIADIVLDQVINNKMLEEDLRDEVRKILNSQHVFAHQKRKRSIMPGSDSDKNLKKSFSKGKYMYSITIGVCNRLYVIPTDTLPTMWRVLKLYATWLYVTRCYAT